MTLFREVKINSPCANKVANHTDSMYSETIKMLTWSPSHIKLQAGPEPDFGVKGCLSAKKLSCSYTYSDFITVHWSLSYIFFLQPYRTPNTGTRVEHSGPMHMVVVQIPVVWIFNTELRDCYMIIYYSLLTPIVYEGAWWFSSHD